MLIRRYNGSDKRAVADLHYKALVETGAYIMDKVIDSDLDDIESVYINPGGEFLVGTIDGKIIAMGALRKMSAERGELKRMRVDPDLQRHGLGQEILTELEKRARELGFKSIQLDTSMIQKVAQHFYEKNGYVEFNRSTAIGNGCIYYQKML